MTKNSQDIPAAVRAIMAEASRQAEAADIDPRNPATDGLPDAHSPDDGEPAATTRGTGQ
ncbi:hypothetical protein HED49_19360 [Ochrobactrum daejeonense]|nr:hypothetical protein [Brucella daejeonensis]